MCGLSGLVQRIPDLRLQRAFLRLSETSLHRRGPDGFATAAIGPGAVLAHARLSIIDIAGGAQPMADERGTIVFNGEIYNHADLRRPGMEYRTRSDTEVLLKGLHDGLRVLDEADGMFAFAWHDAVRRELVLARDRFGIKPLYYFLDGRNFAFASRLQPLMLLSQGRIDRQGLVDYYLGRACRAPRTIFDDIREVLPGEAVVFSLDTFEITAVRRWAAPLPAPRDVTDEATALDGLETALELAIDRHLVSDVPVAVFLSGGVDSSLVSALTARRNPDVVNFSIGFTDPRFDESGYAAAVCRHTGTRHEVRRCDAAEFIERLDDWPAVVDDVVADPSAVMLALLAEHARDLGYKVALSGEGADELFGGYNQYYRFLLAKRLAPAARWGAVLPRLAAGMGLPQTRQIQFAHAAAVDTRFYGTGIIFEPYLLPQVLAWAGAAPETADDLSGALALDVARRLPDDILTRTDRATMHGSIETRVPFITRYVAEAAGSLHESLLIRGRTRKYLLKRLAERHVPRECIYRPKVGFDLPLATWLRGPLRERVMDQVGSTWQADHLRPGAMARVARDHMTGRNDNADKLFAFLLLENNVRQLRAISLASVESTMPPAAAALGAATP